MILEQIAEKTRERVQRQKQMLPLEELKERVADMDTDPSFSFEKALRQEGIGFICEVKKASPSKGIIAPDFPYIQIAKDYEAAGAAAISVLTEPDFFLGSIDILREIRKEVEIPVLRKDFVVDEYMIYEAKEAGADAILLICAILTDEQLLEYRTLAERLGMSVLVEAHDEEEVLRAVKTGSRIVGVNNRDLKTFVVDVRNSIRLRELVPRDLVFVSESGIESPEDIDALREKSVDAVLIGETLMRSENKKEALECLRGMAG